MLIAWRRWLLQPRFIESAIVSFPSLMGKRCLQSRPRGPAPKSAQPGRAGSTKPGGRAPEARHHTSSSLRGNPASLEVQSERIERIARGRQDVLASVKHVGLYCIRYLAEVGMP